MEGFLIAVMVCLSLLTGYILLKSISLKRQLRGFAEEVRAHSDEEYGALVRVESFDKEITELADALNEHIRLRQQSAERNARERRELSNIISGISHDFRTPLTASLGYLQMIEKSGELTGSVKEYLGIAIEKNLYLKTLSDDFFEISKIDADSENAPVREPVDLSKLLSERLLEQYEWITEKSLRTEFVIGEGIIAESDPHSLERIVTNILSNAAKYAEEFLEVRLTSDEHGAHLTVSNGFSACEEIDVNRVFEPFYRACSRSKEGSGLGLYVAKALCERLGCDITASSGNGTFTIKAEIPKQTADAF